MEYKVGCCIINMLTDYACEVLGDVVPPGTVRSEGETPNDVMSDLLGGKCSVSAYAEFLGDCLLKGDCLPIVMSPDMFSLQDISKLDASVELLKTMGKCETCGVSDEARLYKIAWCANMSTVTANVNPVSDEDQACITRLVRDPVGAVSYALWRFKKTQSVRYLQIAHKILCKSPTKYLSWQYPTDTFSATYLGYRSTPGKKSVYPPDVLMQVESLFEEKGCSEALRLIVDTACCMPTSAAADSRYACFADTWRNLHDTNRVYSSSVTELFQGCMRSLPKDAGNWEPDLLTDTGDDIYYKLLLFLCEPSIRGFKNIVWSFTRERYFCRWLDDITWEAFLEQLNSATLKQAEKIICNCLCLPEEAFEYVS